jgi:YaiO family outer membrane protein
MNSRLSRITACSALLALVCAAQDLPPTVATSDAPIPLSPFRLELGGYASHVTQGFGNWVGEDGQLWIRANAFFVPQFFIASENRPTGTQRNYGTFYYLNWTKSFYTTQGISFAPQNSAYPGAGYFPKLRIDEKAYFKLLPSRSLVIGGGYTYFDLGSQGHGQIFDVGSIYYHGKWVIQGDLFVNESQPGSLYSASGSITLQHGSEGHYWWGVTAGGGRELYQYVGQVPFDVRFDGYSAGTFYRKWFTHHVGMVASFNYFDKFTAYRQTGGSLHLFFDF